MASLRAWVVGSLVLGVVAALPVAAHTRERGVGGARNRPPATQTSLLTALSAGAAVAKDAGRPGAPGVQTQRPLLLQLNTCGRECEGSDEARADTLSAAIARREPVAVSLNEVCYDQLGALERHLVERGYQMYARFVKTWNVSFGACLGQDYGNVVLTRSKPRDTDRLTYSAQTSSSDKRAIVCVKTTLKDATRVCSTHLVPGSDTYGVRDEQASEARDLVEGYAAPVVLMGDFNTSPTSDILDRVYSSEDFDGGAYGTFLEVDATDVGGECRCGEGTVGDSKIDYVFVERGNFALGSADAATDPFSDHKRLWGRPRWR